jgi:hypothetical protein
LSARLQQSLTTKIARRIMKHCKSLEHEWKEMDVDKKGKISFDQFKIALKKVN